MSLLHGKPGDPLTDKQLLVLQLAAEGLTDKMIARQLGCSQTTAGDHMRAVLYRLRAFTRTHAVTLAFRQGLIR